MLLTYSLFVIPKRFERLTHALEGRCSIQLSYGTILNCGAKVRSFVETCKKILVFFICTNYGLIFFLYTSVRARISLTKL